MNRPRWVSLSVRVYKMLLRLYPAAFRHDYGDPMVQLFRDRLNDAATAGAVIHLWFAALVDLLINASAEWFQQFAQRRWWITALRSVVGFAALILSTGILAYTALVITVFWLIPWDVGNPPAGTFAAFVNDFFESGRWLTASGAVILSAALAFLRHAAARHYPPSALCWRFAGIFITAALVSGIVALAGMGVSRVLFPNFDPWEGDQSYRIALIYWGLIVIGSLIAYFIQLARHAPALPERKRALR